MRRILYLRLMVSLAVGFVALPGLLLPDGFAIVLCAMTLVAAVFILSQKLHTYLRTDLVVWGIFAGVEVAGFQLHARLPLPWLAYAVGVVWLSGFPIRFTAGETLFKGRRRDFRPYLPIEALAVAGLVVSLFR